MNIKIAIADDHTIVAESLGKMLSKQPGMSVVASYGTGTALLEGLKMQQPDVLLLDIHFPDSTGNELVRMIKPLYPDLKILAITSVDDPYNVQDMMQQGCSGYVHKTVTSAMLVEAIETIHAGGEFLQPSLKEGLLKTILYPDNSKNLRSIQLTSREQEILALICEGLTNMEISDKLYLSHRTIEYNRMILYQKFGVKNTASLVKLAVQHGLIK